MGTSLNGLTPSATYSGLIKFGDNSAIGASLKYISDGDGNDTLLAMSTTSLNIGATNISARLGIKGSGSTSATTSLLVQNSAGTASLTVRDDGAIRFRNGDYNQVALGFADQIGFYNDGSLGIVTLLGGVIGSSMTGTRTNFDKPVGIGFFNGSPVASAQLQVDSTTRGFLPPRMTTTQRNAITSPAEGLVIYNTTTAKLNVYTTAWEAITSL
jgi:hypothetical protein